MYRNDFVSKRPDSNVEHHRQLHMRKQAFLSTVCDLFATYTGCYESCISAVEISPQFSICLKGKLKK